MKTILIVDDSATMRRMIKASLSGLKDVSFNQAGTGLEAIERLSLSRVDLILLDLNMPDMHGIEVLRFLRSHQTYRSVPVVVLTTRSDDETRSSALEAGASVFLTKPFSPVDLAGTVVQLLDSK
jgi:two-component system, chemotaxis family, chemotaxis protein CheY